MQQAPILVIGDVMVDHYLWGNCERISPEAPVQIIDIQKETSQLGGAGNVTRSLVALGAKCSLLSIAGDDDIAKELQDLLQEQQITSHLVVEKNRKTTKKTRIIATHSQVIRFDSETKEDISKTSEQEILKIFEDICSDFSLILISDYAKGMLTKDLTEQIIRIANKQGKKTIIDPKGADYVKYKGAYLLTPNKQEAQIALNMQINNKQTLQLALRKLKELASLQISMITLSEEGIAYMQNELVTKPTQAKKVYDVTGAGDTVLASLGYALSLGKDISYSVEFANIAAGIVVGKIGSATATLEEIQQFRNGSDDITNKIVSQKQLQNIITQAKNESQKIVFTNGCFDILHRGHTNYLHQAKRLGDILIVGLNSDTSVKRLKNIHRPINPQEDRAYILASLQSVDYVVVFDQDTPLELISTITPDILAKGDEYKTQDIVGSDIAKETILISMSEGKSTTSIIEKIIRSH